MSVFITAILVYVVGVVLFFAYLAYTDANDTSLSEDERASWVTMLLYALVWPILFILWLLAKIMSGLRALHS